MARSLADDVCQFTTYPNRTSADELLLSGGQMRVVFVSSPERARGHRGDMALIVTENLSGVELEAVWQAMS